MLIYYLIFVCTQVLSVLSAHSNKKYQLTAGTHLIALSVYMIINGIVSAILPAIVMVITGENFEITAYSLLMALATILSAATNTIGTLKAYEKGQVAVVTIFSTIGNIVISCAWGIFFLQERISIGQIIAIMLMIIAVLIIIVKKGEEIKKEMLVLLLLIAVTSSLTSVLSKQHQVEQVYASVNTLSYSVWIGLIRMLIFSILLIFFMRKGGQRIPAVPICNKKTSSDFEMEKLTSDTQNGKKVISQLALAPNSLWHAILAAVLSGTAYIATLTTAMVLPLTITSPLGTVLTILLTTMMAWVAYREKLSKRQMAGIALCIVGILIFAWS